MTLSPVAAMRITVPSQDCWSIPPEAEARICQIPACANRASQSHHVVRRSATGGPVDWVAIDGVVIWNKVRVCHWCHERLNIHDLWIMWVDGSWTTWARDRHGSGPGQRGEWAQHPKSNAWFFLTGRVKMEKTHGRA